MATKRKATAGQTAKFKKQRDKAASPPRVTTTGQKLTAAQKRLLAIPASADETARVKAQRAIARAIASDSKLPGTTGALDPKRKRGKLKVRVR